MLVTYKELTLSEQARFPPLCEYYPQLQHFNTVEGTNISYITLEPINLMIPRPAIKCVHIARVAVHSRAPPSPRVNLIQYAQGGIWTSG
jgi:hypothetical protein